MRRLSSEKGSKTMKIYNTMSKQKEEFVPIEEGKIRMYVCGPTVYNLIHIGNARPMIVFDTFRRFMEYKGYKVCYVSNYTDVDDKIIKTAMDEGTDCSSITERYISEVEKDMSDLNIMEATAHPKATEEIQGMVNLIDVLVKKGFAYPVTGKLLAVSRLVLGNLIFMVGEDKVLSAGMDI